METKRSTLTKMGDTLIKAFELAESFNDMTDKLKKTRENIEEQIRLKKEKIYYSKV